MSKSIAHSSSIVKPYVIIARMLAVIAACGGKKQDRKAKAHELYRSPRIKYLYRQCKDLGVDLFILSSKYGLIHAEEEIEPYEAIMTAERCEKLLASIKEKLKGYSVVVYYRGGARKEYLDCIQRACEEPGIRLISFGYGNMGGINRIGEVVREVLST